MLFTKEGNMKKHVLIATSFMLALFGGVMCLSFGCKKSQPPLEVEYVTCDEKFSVADENGWKRGIESEALPNLSTQGLESEAYDFSLISEQNYGLPEKAKSGVTTKGFGLDLDLKNGYITLKFSHIDYTGFLKYVTYLYDSYGANLNINNEVCDDVSLLIQTNSSENMLSYTFEAYFTHKEKTFQVKVFYIQAGNNSTVMEGEMYLTLPLLFKGGLNKDEINKQLGEVVETWPGWTHLNYAQTPVYQYIPSIYSEYYEVSDVDGWTQIYVPSYTNKMQEFYEEQLEKAGFFETTFDECEELKSVAEKSVPFIPGNAKVYKLKLFQNCWYIAIYRHGTYLQISPVLKEITEREEGEEWSFDTNGEYEDYNEYLKAFNEACKDYHFTNPLIKIENENCEAKYDISTESMKNVYPYYAEGTYITLTQTFSNEMSYEDYLKYYNKRPNYFADLKSQNGGVYFVGGGTNETLLPGIKLAGTDKYMFYEISRYAPDPNNLYDEDYFNFDYETYKDKLEKFYYTRYDYHYELNVNGKWYYFNNDKIEPTSNGKIKFYIQWSYKYFIKKVESDFEYTAFYKNFKPVDAVQKLIDAKLILSKIDYENAIIEKDDKFIVLTMLDNDKLEDCYQEVIEFASEEERRSFERTFELNGDEKFYSSLGDNGLLIENMDKAKIPNFLSGLYKYQNAANNEVLKFIDRVNKSEFWQTEFALAGCPTSSTPWLDTEGFIDNPAALEYASLDPQNHFNLIPYDDWPYWLHWSYEGCYAAIIIRDINDYIVFDYFCPEMGYAQSYLFKDYDFTTVMFERTIQKLTGGI